MRTRFGFDAFMLAAFAMAVPLLGGMALTASPTAAQEEPASCRCVDADGNEIEDCTCFRAPRMSQVLPRIAFFGDARPRLGITVDAARGPDSDVEGALVTDVLDGGPADDAGLQDGDIITHIDGRSLSEPIGAEAERDFDLDGSVPAQRLLALARDLEPGQEVEIVYVRDGRQQSTVVEAEDLSDRWGTPFEVRTRPFDRESLRDLERMRERLGEGARAWRFRMDPDREGLRGDVRVFGHPDGDVNLFGPDVGMVFGPGGLGAGLELVDLNPALGAYFGVGEGVLVTDVARSSTLGLEPGDVVLAVGGREVTSPGHLRRILGSYARDEDIELSIVRDGERMTLTGPMRRP